MAATDPGSDQPKGQQPMLARHRAKEQGANTHSTPPNINNRVSYFPLGMKEGWNQWWAGTSPAVTEHKVLSFIPYLKQAPTHGHTGTSETLQDTSVNKTPENEAPPVLTDSQTDPYGPRRWKSDLVALEGKDRYLNEFSVERVGEDVCNNLVMLHGYGAGLGFFFRNFEPLSRPQGWKLYALDLLGMGRSSRPPFRIHAKERQAKIAEAEAWFVDSLEEWRIKKGIDRFTLLGHSLGGYMAVAYALKYPGRLNKLILASPVGIPEDPYAVNADLPEPPSSALGNEITQSSQETTAGSSASSSATTKTTTPPPRRPTPKWFATLWDANISPFSLVRLTGPLGPRLVSGWTSRRFAHLPDNEAQALHDYSYSLFRQRGSGEYALAYVLAPGAFARSPLIRRMQGVGRQWIDPSSGGVSASGTTADDNIAPPSSGSSSLSLEGKVARVRETGIPVVALYGEHDWMDVRGGHDAVEQLRLAKERALAAASADEKRRENGDAKVIVIRKAGHHVYLDSAEHFNEVVEKEMRDVERRQKRLGYQ